MSTDEPTELEQRLHTIGSPSYRDPARADLPALDLACVALAVLGLSALLLWWGMP